MLRRLMGAKRFAWNWALGESNASYRATGRRAPSTELSRAFTALRQAPGTAWLSQLPREPFNQVLRDLERAFTNAFAGQAKFPAFKRRGAVSALRFTLDQRRAQVDRERGRVQIDGVGNVRFRVTEPLIGRLRSVTIRLDGAGRWFASFTADGVPVPKVGQAPQASLGIDLGLRDAVVLSTGERVAAPKPLKAKLARLRRYQRRFGRQRDHQLRLMGLDPAKPIPKGIRIPVSNRSRRTQQAVGRLHAQVADQRRDFQHQLSRRIADTAQVIAIEDLNLAAMAKGMGRRAFRRSVADVGLGELRRQIEYKAAWAGRTVVRVDRFYPSSRTCGECATIRVKLELEERVWACAHCGAEHDRDINAARNIEREGLRLLADLSTPRSGGIDARGESNSASVDTTKRRAQRTANFSNARTAGSPRTSRTKSGSRGAG
jgi:putative transposase